MSLPRCFRLLVLAQHSSRLGTWKCFIIICRPPPSSFQRVLVARSQQREEKSWDTSFVASVAEERRLDAAFTSATPVANFPPQCFFSEHSYSCTLHPVESGFTRFFQFSSSLALRLIHRSKARVLFRTSEMALSRSEEQNQLK
jgi:hypothetical protein